MNNKITEEAVWLLNNQKEFDKKRQEKSEQDTKLYWESLRKEKEKKSAKFNDLMNKMVEDIREGNKNKLENEIKEAQEKAKQEVMDKYKDKGIDEESIKKNETFIDIANQLTDRARKNDRKE